MEHAAVGTLTRPDTHTVAAFVNSQGGETPAATAPKPTDSPKRSLARRVFSEGGSVFVLSLLIYLVVSVLLAFKYESFLGDAFSRMANGSYVLYSRDPHLGAIGFVWEPLTSMVDMFFLLGNAVWPALSHNDMAGSLTSAISMAGAAYQLHAALREWGLTRTSRLVLTAFFVINPMILLYAGNGMSEGLYLFTLMAATRYLLRWIRIGDLRSLAYAAISLGFAYLTRNEAAGSIIAGALCVLLVSYRRSDGQRSSRRATALSDAAIFAVPGIVAAAGWAITSYVITGTFFGQYSSVYGSSEQEALLSHESLHFRILYEFHAMYSLSPTILLILPAAIIAAAYKRDARIVAPLTVLTGALGFDALALLNNNIQPYFRYFIVTVPIAILLVGAVISPTPPPLGSNANDRPARPRPAAVTKLLRNAGALLLVLATMIAATATTGAAMFNPKIGPEELLQLGFVFNPHPSSYERAYGQRYPQILHLSSYFARLKLPDGDVIVDNSVECVPEVITTISQPKLFVIPNNRDFQRTLADPLAFHAHYILEPNPSVDPVTASNIEFPSLWSNGDGFAKMVRQFPSRGTCPKFRLFKVISHPTQIR
jgi:hypothetical protein